MKRTKLNKKPLGLKRTEDTMIRNIYKVKATFVNSVYTSVIDNGDQNIVMRLTFAESMRLNDSIEHNPIAAVAMNIMDFIKLYNSMTMHLQTLREQKKVP
jgi:hypothetical protein